MSAGHTIFIRADDKPRRGCSCRATVPVTGKAGAVAYVGEVPGRVDVRDALHVTHMEDTRGAWGWVAAMGYALPQDEVNPG